MSAMMISAPTQPPGQKNQPLLELNPTTAQLVCVKHARSERKIRQLVFFLIVC